jgi:hypothetical protein
MIGMMMNIVQISHAQTDTLICQNGGFENDFQFYRGKIAVYNSGSSTCTPVNSSGVPVTFTNATLPLNRRFEIVSSGNDPLVNIPKTKFGTKALKLNNEFGHLLPCDGNFGVDRLTKRFRVTAENRNFTVWYAVVLENPDEHVNQQPFFNIKCDKAPASDLCFDAEILKCRQKYPNGCNYDSIDVLNWACHRVFIPADKIGQIATLEITMGDCGKGAHFGYAYIDGICEECTGSSLGSGTIIPEQINYCLGDRAKVCGSYTLPTLCNDTYSLTSLTVPGVQIQNLTIDYANKTFCFEVSLSAFGNNECIEFVVHLLFTSSTNSLPLVYTNNVKLCKSLITSFNPSIANLNASNINYLSCYSDVAKVCGTFDFQGECGYDLYELTIPGYVVTDLIVDQVNKTFCFNFPKSNFLSNSPTCLPINVVMTYVKNGQPNVVITSNALSICKNNYVPKYNVSYSRSGCFNNTTPDKLSDDYYTVNVSISSAAGSNWTIGRLLTNPYPNESGKSVLKTGTGNINIKLGPFMIQEGTWELSVQVGDCVYKFTVTPPEYCSFTQGCDLFGGTVINNVTCNNNTWSYDIFLPTPAGQNPIQYTVGTTPCFTGYACTIYEGSITFPPRCIEKEISISLPNGSLCYTKFTICPPKPCPIIPPATPCDLEMDIRNIKCDPNNANQFEIDIDVSTNTTQYICYRTNSGPNSAGSQVGSTSTNSGNSLDGNTDFVLTGMTGDVYVIAYLCPTPGCNCTSPSCYKIIHVPQPKDCSNRLNITGRSKSEKKEDILQVIPNPFYNDEFELLSTMEETKFELYNSSGVLLHRNSFKGTNHRINLVLSTGMYFIRYIDSHGEYKGVKVVKI